ncbi:MAG: HAMP domain-containing histidine kinase [Chloroflexi bacterium]|nr:MAG: HAMP domain-containing histidine kinase [Chloroflexota bacterium]
MFSAARWRLTFVFTGVLVVVLIACGIVVYLTTRSVIYGRVDHDLEDRARSDLVLFQRGPREEPDRGPPRSGSEFDPGGYFYAISNADGQILSSSPYLDSEALPSTATLVKAVDNGDTFTDTKSSKGEPQRVYVFPVTVSGGGGALVQIGRSIEPEEAALSQLRIILLAVLAASIVPAVAGGYLLSGRALRPIKTAMESQRIFIADASHELRTPVAVVRTNAELLKRHFEPDTAQTAGSDQVALDDILSESDRLGRMVDQMLTLAEADAGQRTVLTAEVSLNELVDQVTRSMRSLAEAREISLNAQLNSDISLSGDPSRLRELLTVLLDNAVKYTDAGGRVDVSVRKEHRKAIITVSDNGPGIPSEALPHVFDRFYRVDEARSRESGGTGLGLAIARHIVEAHSGTIDVESKIREGTVVTVELPA